MRRYGQYHIAVTIRMTKFSLHYSAVAPGAEFSLVSQTTSGDWEVLHALGDWPQEDYEAAVSLPGSAFRVERTVLTDRTYLVAFSDDEESEECENGLYERFASIRPTPKNLLLLASEHGLLRQSNTIQVGKRDAAKLQRLLGLPRDDGRELRIECCADWLYIHHFLDLALRLRAKHERQKDAQRLSALRELFSFPLGGTLGLEFRLDDPDGKPGAALVATSLASALKIQLGMSLTGEALPRRCPECSTWFSVASGSGRPEKIYCSAACKMRAYRRRKTG